MLKVKMHRLDAFVHLLRPVLSWACLRPCQTLVAPSRVPPDSSTSASLPAISLHLHRNQRTNGRQIFILQGNGIIRKSPCGWV